MIVDIDRMAMRRVEEWKEVAVDDRHLIQHVITYAYTGLSPREVARLRFLKWRVEHEGIES